MSICTIPPAGWSCSREPGHDGPCAARRIFPYEDYTDKILTGGQLARNIHFEWWGAPTILYDFTERELRSLIADAWLEGLKYSLVMIESEKRRRDASQD